MGWEEEKEQSKKKQQEILKFNRHKSNTKNAPGLVPRALPGSVPRIKDKQATSAAFGFWVLPASWAA